MYIQASTFGKEKDQQYMKSALLQAKKAFQANEVPIGALVVDSQGVIISRGYNRVEALCTQAAHAEIIAISKAGKKKEDWRLEGCWLYVTLEPCALCINLIILSRLAGIVFGPRSPLFGFQSVDNKDELSLYKKHTLQIVAGVGERESCDLLKKFFQSKRKNHCE